MATTNYRKFKFQLISTLVVISTEAFLILDPRTLQIKFRLPATEIYRISLSPYEDDIFVLHIKAVRKLIFLNSFDNYFILF